jgi:hypothetical protein
MSGTAVPPSGMTHQSLGFGDLHDIRHAKPLQLANLLCAPILVREPPTDELAVFSTRRVGKNRNSRRDAV